MVKSSVGFLVGSCRVSEASIQREGLAVSTHKVSYRVPWESRPDLGERRFFMNGFW